MKEIQEKLITLMKEIKMNEGTIEGAKHLLKTEEQVKTTIDYINRYKNIITNHQLRQFLVEITQTN